MKRIYSKKQQLYSLSLLTNAAFGLTFSGTGSQQGFVRTVVQQTLADAETELLIGSDWTTVWGPVVYAGQSAEAAAMTDHAMMLLYSPSQQLFAAAISGINAQSLFSWFREDLKTNRTVKWEEITGKALPRADKNAAISLGTQTGLDVLLKKMKDSSGKSMLQALAACLPRVEHGAEIAVCGHSLGGALAIPLALYLKERQEEWNTGNKVTAVSAYPTGAPACGNEAFARCAGAQLKCESVYNDQDVVPYCWQADTLPKVPELYAGHIRPAAGMLPGNPIIGRLCAGAVLNTVDTSGRVPALVAYRQVQPWVPLQGSFSIMTDAKIQAKLSMINLVMPGPLKQYIPYLVNLLRFMAQLGYQHSDAYHSLLNIDKFVKIYDIVVAANAPAGQNKERALLQAMGQAAAGIAGIDLLEKLADLEPEAAGY